MGRKGHGAFPVTKMRVELLQCFHVEVTECRRENFPDLGLGLKDLFPALGVVEDPNFHIGTIELFNVWLS